MALTTAATAAAMVAVSAGVIEGIAADAALSRRPIEEAEELVDDELRVSRHSIASNTFTKIPLSSKNRFRT